MMMMVIIVGGDEAAVDDIGDGGDKAYDGNDELFT